MEPKPTIQEVKNEWSVLSNVYKEHDTTPQTFYFSLINILRLHEAHNILEVGCGRCILLPFTFQLKNPDATYLASDLTPEMIKLAEEFLRNHLHQYESKLTYEEWMDKNKATLRIANGEEPFNESVKFDRIICNMVLMLTENAQKMLQNLSDSAAKGCLMGISIWGNEELNKFFGYFDIAMKQLGLPLPNIRSEYYLYKKVGEIAEKAGWQVVVKWQQSASFHFIYVERIIENAKFMVKGMKHLNEQEQNKVFELYSEKMKKNFEEKRGLIFPAQLYVLRKK